MTGPRSEPRRRPRAALAGLGLLLGLACSPPAERPIETPEEARVLRIALFNVKELSAAKLEAADPQVLAAAEIVRRVAPDVLVLQEIDLPERGPLEAHAELFRDRYLGLPYPHVFVAPSNTGLLTGLDLDRNGIAATAEHRGDRLHGDDSFGFGIYPGQYAMAVLSRVPIDRAAARTFQRFPWKDLPGHHLPTGFYPPAAIEILRLSSKSHWDLPLELGEHRLHLLVSHPTPPVFDGPEDRNGRRNFDEIGFWAAYLDGEPALHDDQGRSGGLEPDAAFVVAGDLNARPDAEERYVGRDGRETTAIGQLLERPDVQDPPAHRGRPSAEFLDGVRVDYLLPGSDLEVTGGGVYWPSPEEDPEGAELATTASDHRMVWLDLRLP